jgi:hypothetical protein
MRATSYRSAKSLPDGSFSAGCSVPLLIESRRAFATEHLDAQLVDHDQEGEDGSAGALVPAG